MNELIDYKSN